MGKKNDNEEKIDQANDAETTTAAPEEQTTTAPEKSYPIVHGSVMVAGEMRGVGRTVKESELAPGQAEKFTSDGYLGRPLSV
jgi:hypothetical protein